MELVTGAEEAQHWHFGGMKPNVTGSRILAKKKQRFIGICEHALMTYVFIDATVFCSYFYVILLSVILLSVLTFIEC